MVRRVPLMGLPAAFLAQELLVELAVLLVAPLWVVVLVVQMAAAAALRAAALLLVLASLAPMAVLRRFSRTRCLPTSKGWASSKTSKT